MTQRDIKEEWIFDTIENNSIKKSISDIETWYFMQISEAGNRCLKVVFNPSTMKIITVYFDRNMRKKGCK